MVDNAGDAQTALVSLRNYLSEQKLALNGRLPAERQLCSELNLSRGKLRKALAQLESEGQIWRHVGRGTFIGPRPVLNLSDVEYLSEQSRPTEVMEARMAVEPQLAKLASLHSTASNFAEIRRCNRRCRAAKEWRVYEAWDNNFHQAIASATCNRLLISLFDTLNIVRRSTVWGQLRSTKLPPADHRSFDEHDAIYEAIAARDPELAAECMRTHLRSVRDRTFSSLDS
ncbi:FadR/GntR family transcriptional regulator [Pelagibius sp. Alg239-R121]|uniref:FadR/GntR family transcriptional regulator n=1 Tax=Pelagibius sp. Alg239-R121 TaxID=2993448 RepID=UPI0024A6585C|nr:FCD domain-containing protein [Pelagibius sp. Alg239-R121]